MKKELKSKSKRKWIISGLAAFTSVSLLTTGFAVWVVGVNYVENKNDVNVTVDTAQNKSIVFTMSLTSSNIQLKESAQADGKLVRVEKSETVTNPLTVSYKDLQIIYGDNAGFAYKSIKFSIAEPEEGETSYASVKTAANANKLTGSYARNGDSFTYLEAPSVINLSTLSPTKTNGVNVYTITSGSLIFTWGTFFATKSPATFYNEKYKDETDNAKLATASGEITTELTNMYSQLNGKKIKLVATLSTEAVGA